MDVSPAASDAPQNSVETMVDLLRGPRQQWPADWPYWGTTIAAHQVLAEQYRQQIPDYPEGRYTGRGIVILGGGAFFPGVYVTVRMIRHFHCELPIEVWHHRQYEPVEERWLQPFGVRFVDTDAHMAERTPPPRIRGAWASKVYAILHSSFQEVLYLDSDCYPLADVTPLLNISRTGTIFWPNPDFVANTIDWFIYSTDASDKPPITGGVFYFDKSKCWKTLVMAQWWNEHADFAYKHGLGDQDVVRGVWQKEKADFELFTDSPARHDAHVQIDCGSDGRTPMFVHRYNDKFRLACLPIAPARHFEGELYRNDELRGEPVFDDTLPQESVAFQYYHQFIYQLDNDLARYRPGSCDSQVWNQVVHDNVYRLPDRFPKDSRVVDIGAHIGAFTHASIRRGAGHVWGFEVDPTNFAQCTKNLTFWGSRCTLRRLAVWSHRGKVGYVPPSDTYHLFGRVIPDGDVAEALSLDEILQEVSENGSKSIFFLKLDCEMSEWPILFTSNTLSLCEHIVGEYHCAYWNGKYRGPDDIQSVLTRNGFSVQIQPAAEDIGLFWATRFSDHKLPR